MDWISGRRRLLVIYNPTAGLNMSGFHMGGRGKRARLEAYLDLLEEAGCAVEFRPTAKRGDAQAFAAEGLSDRYDAVVAAGGDGTIGEVANGLPAENAAPLGIFPLGTANVLAAEIGLPLQPSAVLRAVLQGPAREIYPGYLGNNLQPERLFTIMAGVGFDAHVVADLPLRLKRLLGKGAYVWQSLALLARWQERAYRLRLDGGEAVSCASAVIAKGHFYGGRFVCCPDARLDAPDFQICLFGKPGRWGAARAMAMLPLGQLQRLPEIRLLRARQVEIEGPADDPVQADGDIAGRLPLSAWVAEKPLRLIYPA